MPTVPLVSDADAGAEVRAIFDDIRATRGTDHVNNFWRALAVDPGQLAQVWTEVKAVMRPGALDPLTKEMIYVAVSATSGCSYCVHSHTAAARAKGMNPAMYGELLAVIALAARTNRLAETLQVPVDERFRVE